MSKPKEVKLHAYVIKDATENGEYGDKWSVVCQTEYMEDGRWITGMNLITSLVDVVERAEKLGVPIIFESMLEDKL